MGGREDKTNVDPFLSPGKFYIQSIIPKKTGAKARKKLKVSLGIQKTLKLLGVMKSRNYPKRMLVHNALSMKSANCTRPGQPL